MKKIYYLLILGCVLGLSSCDFLDTVPKGKVIPTTTEDFGNLMKDPTLSAGCNEFPVYSSDDVTFPGDLAESTGNVYYWKDEFFRKSESDANWEDTYAHVYSVNVVIDNIMSSTEGSLADQERIMAEAKIFRAYYYWLLQSLYGPAYRSETATTDLSVPLAVKPNLEAKLPRSTVEQVTQTILSDLEGIAEKLPVLGSNPYKPTRASAYAMLARVYFYMGRYDDAATQADLALKLNSKLNDMRTWEFANPAKPSTITNRPDDLESPEKLWYHSTSGKGALRNWAISEELKNLYDPKDLRYQLWFSNLNSRGDYYYDEHTYCFVVQQSVLNIGVPEMMLIKAEALARHDNAEALDILNDLRQYRFAEADYRPLEQSNDKTLLDIVLEERRRELAMSGLRWFDMKRLAKEGLYTRTLERTEPNGTVHKLTPNSNRYLYPISPYVLYMNPNIQQNPR